MTSSIRTRSLKEEAPDDFSPLASNGTSQVKDSKSCDDADDVSKDDVKELLLCLRPIRDGDEKVAEEFRFRPVSDADDEAGTESYSEHEELGSLRGPVKKRPLLQLLSSITTVTSKGSTGCSDEREPKKTKTLADTEEDPEKAVAGSLMLMRKA